MQPTSAAPQDELVVEPAAYGILILADLFEAVGGVKLLGLEVAAPDADPKRAAGVRLHPVQRHGQQPLNLGIFRLIPGHQRGRGVDQDGDGQMGLGDIFKIGMDMLGGGKR